MNVVSCGISVDLQPHLPEGWAEDRAADVATLLARIEAGGVDVAVVDRPIAAGLMRTGSLLRIRSRQPNIAFTMAPGQSDGLLLGVDGTLPADDFSDELQRLVRHRHRMRRDRAAPSSRNLLLVDDDELVRMSLGLALQRAGFQVRSASNGDEALAVLREQPIHVICTDVQMAGMDGLTLVEAARNYDSFIVSILITAFPTLERAVEGLRRGAKDFLVKPVAPQKLAASARRAWSQWTATAATKSGATLNIDDPPHVLLIEDEPTDARLAELHLAPVSTSVDTVSSLAAARRALRHKEFQVIVCDLGLPDAQGGIGTFLEVRQMAPTVPIVVLTGDPSSTIADLALQCGARDYLDKHTMTSEAMGARIRNAVRRHLIHHAAAELADALARTVATRAKVMDDQADALIVIDSAHHLCYINPSARALFEDNTAEALQDLLGGLVNDPPPYLELGERIADVQVSATEWDGEPAWLVCLRDTTERRNLLRQTATLNEQLQQANKNLAALSRLDALTQLLNRRGLAEALERESHRSARKGSPLVAVLLDLDDFKSVNDSLGHAVGDVVLTEIAKRLRNGTRPFDVLARIGGDEFLTLLPETRMAEAAKVAERLRVSVGDAPIRVGDKILRLTASAGITSVPNWANSIDEVLSLSRHALKRSKSTGKNKVSGPNGSSAAEEVQAVIASGAGIHAVAQAIIDVQTGQPVGWEMLSRGPYGPFESPATFFPLAMDHNVLTLVDSHCLRTCLAEANKRSLSGFIHVNLLPSTLLATGGTALAAQFAEQHPSDFVIEISEQQFVGDPGALLSAVASLRAEGIRIAIDDVGFGRTSLETLVLLEPEVIKIDQSYLQNCHTDRIARERLDRLVRWLHTLGAELIAEGVETPEQLDVLRELGVPLAQGYHWGRPK